MNISRTKDKHPRYRWEYRLYSALSILLLPFIFVATLAAIVLGRTFYRRYTDDVTVSRNVFSEALSALQGSVWWSFTGR
ncbi:MAG: hypothetical protein AAF292_00400 [Pseudomonadota bacterium]